MITKKQVVDYTKRLLKEIADNPAESNGQITLNKIDQAIKTHQDQDSAMNINSAAVMAQNFAKTFFVENLNDNKFYDLSYDELVPATFIDLSNKLESINPVHLVQIKMF